MSHHDANSLYPTALRDLPQTAEEIFVYILRSQPTRRAGMRIEKEGGPDYRKIRIHSSQIDELAEKGYIRKNWARQMTLTQRGLEFYTISVL